MHFKDRINKDLLQIGYEKGEEKCSQGRLHGFWFEQPGNGWGPVRQEQALVSVRRSVWDLPVCDVS